MKNLLTASALAAAALLGLSSTANATLIPTTSAFYTATANGTLTFTYEGFSAADTDRSIFTFNNATLFTNNATSVGTVVTESVVAGNTYRLSLYNQNTNQTWSSDPTQNPNGEVHLQGTNTYTDFGLTSTAPIAITSNCAFSGGCYLGWEDLPLGGGTTDYNDLVFAEQFTPTAVPEPVSLALLGTGLIGVGIVRRRKSLP